MRGGVANPGWRERFASVGIVLPVDAVVKLSADELLIDYIPDGKDVVLTGVMARLGSLWGHRTLGLGLATRAHMYRSWPASGYLGAAGGGGVSAGGTGGCLPLEATHRRLIKSAAAHARTSARHVAEEGCNGTAETVNALPVCFMRVWV